MNTKLAETNRTPSVPRNRLKLVLSDSTTAAAKAVFENQVALAKSIGLTLSVDASHMVHGWIQERIVAEQTKMLAAAKANK